MKMMRRTGRTWQSIASVERRRRRICNAGGGKTGGTTGGCAMLMLASGEGLSLPDARRRGRQQERPCLLSMVHGLSGPDETRILILVCNMCYVG